MDRNKLREEMARWCASYHIYYKEDTDSLLSLLAPILADAEKWNIYQQERALADAETERFVTLMQADEDELRKDAEKWRKVKEIINTKKLRILADWIDLKYSNDPDPEVQRDLRRWADAIEALTEKEPS